VVARRDEKVGVEISAYQLLARVVAVDEEVAVAVRVDEVRRPLAAVEVVVGWDDDRLRQAGGGSRGVRDGCPEVLQSRCLHRPAEGWR